MRHPDPSSSSALRGFTLIESLVCLGVVGILIALVIPALQSARESARRAQCQSNLKQIGVAIHGYTNDHDVFPPSFGRHFSNFTRLLPYLDSRPLYEAINFDLAREEAHHRPSLENRTARNTKLEIFLCPSDDIEERLDNYRLNQGPADPIDGRWMGPFNDGIAGTPLHRPSGVRDGLSRTAFASERFAGSFDHGIEGDHRDVKMIRFLRDGDRIIPTTEPRIIERCLREKPSTWFTSSGRYWFYGSLSFTAYNHFGVPNDPRTSCGMSWGGLYPPRSHHPGCVVVLFGDGHVEPVANRIEPTVWWALGTTSAND